MPKTPEYTKRAIENYKSKFDVIQIRLPKGTKDKIKEHVTDETISEYITKLVKKDLEKQERIN